MIYIDLPADLNLEDDQGRNIARLSDAVSPEAVTPGAVLVAGAPAPGRGPWSRPSTPGSSTSARSAPRTRRDVGRW